MIAFALSLGIGVLLGVLGSGGSIAILPVLVYTAGIDLHSAVPMSMAIVGATSVVAAWLHARQGHFHMKAVLFLGTTGMAGAYIGSAGTRMVSTSTLLLLFAGVLLAAGVILYQGGIHGLAPGVCRPVRCMAAGAVVGLLSGFLGVGGGFLIVPVLVLFAGLETKRAVGTSLAIIALNSGAGLAGQIRYAELDWRLTAAFTGVALVGMLGGVSLSERIAGDALRKAFAALLVAMAVVVGALNLFSF